jgi:hypothetical protein
VTGLGDAVQEGAIVGDDQGGAAGRDEFLFEQFDGEDVDVVGRLVEQEQVRLLGEGLGQGGAAGLAAGEVDVGLCGSRPKVSSQASAVQCSASFEVA